MRRPSLLPLLLVGLAAPPAARAQGAPADTLAFERVGDLPIDAYDLAFSGDTLWASKSELYRLVPGDTAWAEVYEWGHRYVLPLHPDTLLISGPVSRSTDGGATWAGVYPEGERLFEAPLSGVLLTGDVLGPLLGGLAYSHDRGATWEEGAVVGGTGTWWPKAEGFAEVPEGHAETGRLVAACWAGMSYSDDGGATWRKSSLWEDGGRYYAFDVAAGVDGTLYGAYYEQGVPGLQIAASADGGATYAPTYRFTTYHSTGVRVVALPGGADPAFGVLVVVHSDGSVYRSDDGARTWREVGQVPFGEETDHMEDAVLGPDGRLYVSGVRIGPADEWVYRTTGPLVAAAVVGVGAALADGGTTQGEGPDVGSGGGPLRFAVTLANATDEPQAFEAWTAVAGPVALSPVLGPVAVTLPAGATVTRVLTQGVPGAAPDGTYTYTVNVGDYPDGAVSSASFAVEKGPGGGGSGSSTARGPGGESWAVSGWDDAAVEPAAGVSVSVGPNPTRGAAEVTLALAAPGAVAVALYDVLGRRVAALHEGVLAAGTHVFALDASALRPGLYVVRAEAGGAVATRTVTRLR